MRHDGGKRRLGYRVRARQGLLRPRLGGWLGWTLRTRQRLCMGGMLPGGEGWEIRGWGWEGDVFVIHVAVAGVKSVAGGTR